MNPRVLVVDDRADSSRATRAVLEARGLDVESAMDGPSALERLERRRPDVILLEVGMTPMGGMKVLDRIRSNPQHSGIPVILMAGSEDDNLLEGYKFGADYYLTK